jgi:hypothetical protein
MDLTLPAVGTVNGSGLASARIALTYLWRHHRFPRLSDPRTFNELVQNRKLHDRDERLPILADKVRAKSVVQSRIGSEWIIPTLWHGTALPSCPPWPTPFVVKSRHGCNQIRFVHTVDPTAWRTTKGKARRWMQTTYGSWLDEWAYRDIPKGILVEPFMGCGRELPLDYKFFVFGGRVEYIQVHLDRGKNPGWLAHGGVHRWIVFNRQWQRRSSRTSDADPARPINLTRMIEAAEELGRGLDFVRVDLYEIDGHPLFGELTFYPGSGLDPFDPVELDQEMGTRWLRARQRTDAVKPRWTAGDCTFYADMPNPLFIDELTY